VKSDIASMILDEIRNLDPPGRFLDKDEDLNLWFDIGDKKARYKICQSLREKKWGDVQTPAATVVAAAGRNKSQMK
jgi:hypothetical protein